MNVVEVTNNRQFKTFLKVPDIINLKIDNYISALKLNTISALNKKKNPLWKYGSYRLFVAYKEMKPVGRVAAIYSVKHHELYNDNCGYFGYFDCINDESVAFELLTAAQNALLSHNCVKMIGPINPTTNYELGILVEGFDTKPYFMMNFNQPYYGKILENLGCYKEMSFKAYTVPCDLNNEKIVRVSNKLKKRYDIRIENIDFTNLTQEAKTLCSLYNDAFESHWGAIPFSEDEFVYVVHNMKLLMNKELIFKLFLNGELAGFIMALPNWNEVIEKLKNGRLNIIGAIKFLYFKKKISRVKVTVAAIQKKYQRLGLGSVLYTEMAERVKKSGYAGGELSWIAENNFPMNKVILSMDARETKVYQIFGFYFNDSTV